MEQTPLEKIAGQIDSFLLLATTSAWASYRNFAMNHKPKRKFNETPETTTTNFAAYHRACKTALAHLEQLLRLSSWADKTIANTPRETTTYITTLVEKAQTELSIAEDGN